MQWFICGVNVQIDDAWNDDTIIQHDRFQIGGEAYYYFIILINTGTSTSKLYSAVTDYRRQNLTSMVVRF